MGWGDRVLEGFVPEYLGKISLDDCVDYIETGKDLLASVSEANWVLLRKIARASKIEINTRQIMESLEKHRPDVLSIIINHPQGQDWLDRQVVNCREKLDME